MKLIIKLIAAVIAIIVLYLQVATDTSYQTLYTLVLVEATLLWIYLVIDESGFKD